MTSRVLLIAGVVVLLLLGGAIVVGVVVAARSSSSSSVASVGTSLPHATSFPAPPRGAVVYARQDGGDALALAVRPVANRLELQVSAVSGQGLGIRGLGVTVGVQPGTATRLRATACGAGCYRATAPLPSRPRSVTVEVARSSRETVWRVPIEVWPPQPAAALVARAERVWRNLKSFEFSEQLASDATNSIDSTWRVVAPDRLSYKIEGSGGAGVVIGDARWDYQGGKWIKSRQARLDLPQPTWQPHVRNAHVIGHSTVNNTRATRVSFFDATGRAWFDIGIATPTTRTMQLHMTTTAHFMRQAFSRFNEPIVIKPPVSG